MKSTLLAIVLLSLVAGLPAFGQSPMTFRHDLNGDGAPEAISISGTNADITSPGAKVRRYPVGDWNYVQFAELDGRPGDEMLITNLKSFSGVPQPARATVITFLINLAKPYSIGSPNYMQLRELDGQPGLEVVFTNLWSLQGVPQPAAVRILSSHHRTLTSYSVGGVNHMEFAEMDGQPGDEILFTSLRTINTIPQPAIAAVVDFRAKTVQKFSVGNATSYSWVRRKGKPGSEVVFTRRTGAPITVFYDDASHTFAKR